MGKNELLKKMKKNKKNNDQNKWGMAFYNFSLVKAKGIKPFKPVNDDYTVVTVPFPVGVNRMPDEKEGDTSYVVLVYVHYKLGVDGKENAICMAKTYGKKCPVCDYVKTHELDEETQKDLKPKERALYFLKEKGSDDVKFFQVSAPLFEHELGDAREAFAKSGECDPSPIYTEDGCYFTFTDTGVKGLQRFKNFIFKTKEKDLIKKVDKKITDQVFPLDEVLNLHAYDEIKKNMYFDMDELDDSETDENEEPLEAYVEHLPKEKKKKDKDKKKKKKNKDKD